MKDRPVILRGDAWAARLQGHLSTPPDEARAWMAEHTHRLKDEKYAVSGLLRLGGDLCFLKFYGFRWPGARHALRFHAPRALRAFDAAASLRWQEVAVPRPRACLLVRPGLLVLSKGIEAAETLHYLFSGGIKDDLASHLMRAAGEEIAQMHLSGHAHGDLRWNNLLWGRDRLYISHLEKARRVARQSARQWRDLAQFTVDAEELGIDPWHYEQFMEAYTRRVEIDKESLVERMRGPLGRIRNKHWARYGTYSARLV
ncbi:MAG: hypothetical protein HKN19_09395 [Halioglobus sp.]|nr:hypothetical protein [Halioglobus sp.]